MKGASEFVFLKLRDFDIRQVLGAPGPRSGAKAGRRADRRQTSGLTPWRGQLTMRRDREHGRLSALGFEQVDEIGDSIRTTHRVRAHRTRTNFSFARET